MRSFYIQNRANLLGKLEIGEIALFFSGEAPQSTADSKYEYRADKNFFYLTGLTRENFILVLEKTKDKIIETIFIEEPIYDVEKWVGRKLTKEQVKEISGLETINYLQNFESYLNKLIYNNNYDSIYLDLARMKFEGETTTSMVFAEKIQKNYPAIRIKNSHKYMNELRMIKSDFEIQEIKNAINLTKNGLEAIMKTLKPGQYEYEPSAEFNYSIMKNGADTNAFTTIAAAGENAVILHYVENNTIIQDGDLVLFDLGAQLNQYASDITRTYPANGKFTDRQNVLYNIVLKAHDEVMAIMKPGLHFEELNKKCSQVIADELMKINLIQNKSELSKYYYHGVSHFMGLDVHDLGSRDIVLEPGMVFTVEPGLYIAEEKIGIRIENDILITEDGYENLSKDIVRTVEEIENFMK